MSAPPLRVLTAAWPSEREPRRARFLEDLHRALAGRFASEVLAPRVGEDPVEEVRDGIPIRRFRYPSGGAPVRARGISPLAALAYLVSLERAARARWPRADRARGGLVLAHWLLPAGVAAARLARRLRLPLVLYAHGSDIHTYGQGAIGRLLLRRILPAASLVIAASEALAASLRGLVSAPPPIEVLPLGIHPAFTALPPPPPPPPLRALFVGDPLPQKGAPVLARAVARARREGLPIELEWAGAPSRGVPAPAAGRALGDLSPEEVAQAMARAHLLILPSEQEGTPLSLQEAIAMRLPWAATPVGGIPALAAAWAGGTLLPAAPEALEEGIVALLRSRLAEGAAGQRARREAMERADVAPLGVAPRAARLAARLESLAGAP